MATYQLMAGLILIVGAGAGFWSALPKNGKLSIVGHKNFYGEVVAIGVIVCLAMGLALIAVALRA